MDFHHISVLGDEVIHFLAPRPGGVYLDGTVGGAGHSAAILTACGADGLLIGFDRDQDALAVARQRLAPFASRVRLVHGNFSGLDETLSALGIAGIDGMLLDLGVSSYQLDTAERGFSFSNDAPLDMRMDRSSGLTAAELLNSLSELELARIIRDYGEERWAVRIASRIVRGRQDAPLESTLQLADLVKGAIPRAKWEERIHPATRTFQALRIAVNGELESLQQGLAAGIRHLKPGGRAVVISFHSLEDRIVKQHFRALAQGCTCPKQVPICVCGTMPQVKILTGRPVQASLAEVAGNPRARSAKLRAVEKL